MKLKYSLFFILIITLTSCKENVEFNKIVKADDPELKYAKAMEYYQQGSYYKAIQLIEMIIPYYRVPLNRKNYTIIWHGVIIIKVII